MPWKIGFSLAAVECAEIGRITEYLHIFEYTWRMKLDSHIASWSDSRRNSHQERQV